MLSLHKFNAVKKEIIYGFRPVIEAVRSGKNFDRIYIQNTIAYDKFKELKNLFLEYGIPFQLVPVEKLNKMVYQNHQGIAGISSYIEYYSIETLLPGIYEKGEVPFIIVLDRITDVRNLGSISRSASCAGCHAMIIPQKESAQINADAMKTSAGALANIPICREISLSRTIQYLKESGLSIFAASEKGSLNYYEADYSKPLALVMGSEGKGISTDILKKADEIIRIPMVGEIASLNVSVAAGIILFEKIRQCGIV